MNGDQVSSSSLTDYGMDKSLSVNSSASSMTSRKNVTFNKDIDVRIFNKNGKNNSANIVDSYVLPLANTTANYQNMSFQQQNGMNGNQGGGGNGSFYSPESDETDNQGYYGKYFIWFI
jgi:hypothetical protein